MWANAFCIHLNPTYGSLQWRWGREACRVDEPEKGLYAYRTAFFHSHRLVHSIPALFNLFTVRRHLKTNLRCWQLLIDDLYLAFASLSTRTSYLTSYLLASCSHTCTIICNVRFCLREEVNSSCPRAPDKPACHRATSRSLEVYTPPVFLQKYARFCLMIKPRMARATTSSSSILTWADDAANPLILTTTMTTHIPSHNGPTRAHPWMLEWRERPRIHHTPIVHPHPRWHQRHSYPHMILVSVLGRGRDLWPLDPAPNPPSIPH